MFHDEMRVQYRPSSLYLPTTYKSNPFYDGRMCFKLEISLAFGVCEVNVQHIVHFILQCDVLLQVDDTHTQDVHHARQLPLPADLHY